MMLLLGIDLEMCVYVCIVHSSLKTGTANGVVSSEASRFEIQEEPVSQFKGIQAGNSFTVEKVSLFLLFRFHLVE